MDAYANNYVHPDANHLRMNGNPLQQQFGGPSRAPRNTHGPTGPPAARGYTGPPAPHFQQPFLGPSGPPGTNFPYQGPPPIINVHHHYHAPEQFNNGPVSNGFGPYALQFTHGAPQQQQPWGPPQQQFGGPPQQQFGGPSQQQFGIQQQQQFGGPPQQQFGGPPQQQFGGPPQQQFGGQQQQFGGPPQQQFGGPPQQQFGGPPHQQQFGFQGPQDLMMSGGLPVRPSQQFGGPLRSPPSQYGSPTPTIAAVHTESNAAGPSNTPETPRAIPSSEHENSVHDLSDAELADMFARYDNIDITDTADDLQLVCECMNIGQTDEKPDIECAEHGLGTPITEKEIELFNDRTVDNAVLQTLVARRRALEALEGKQIWHVLYHYIDVGPHDLLIAYKHEIHEAAFKRFDSEYH